jgi:hypothetical protein
MRLALLVVVVAGFGCSTLVDVERARDVFRGTEEPTVPILVESPALELPAPRGLRAIPGQLRAIPLAWDPLLTGDVCGYVIERRQKKAGRFQRISSVPGRFETRFVDRGDDLAAKQGSAGGRADLGDGASSESPPHRIPMSARPRPGCRQLPAAFRLSAISPGRSLSAGVRRRTPRWWDIGCSGVRPGMETTY